MMIQLQIFFASIVNVILPLYFFAWLVFAKTDESLAIKVSAVLCVSIFIFFIAMAGAWHIFGTFWNYIYLLLYVSVLIIVIHNINTANLLPVNGVKGWINLTVLTITFLVFLFWRMPQLYSARSYITPAVELEFPLRTGRFMITQGGNTSALNHHYKNPAQKFALDIVKVNKFGFRASSLLPSELEHYYIFNQPLYAPCDGKVIAIENNLEDLIPPAMDKNKVAGNYVVLLCGKYSVLLAHLQHGSINVLPGQNLTTGTFIGRVGNSGNTSEPHLHIHAVKGSIISVDDITQTTEAVPMLFNSKFLIRNDQLTMSDNL